MLCAHELCLLDKKFLEANSRYLDLTQHVTHELEWSLKLSSLNRKFQLRLAQLLRFTLHSTKLMSFDEHATWTEVHLATPPLTFDDNDASTTTTARRRDGNRGRTAIAPADTTVGVHDLRRTRRTTNMIDEELRNRRTFRVERWVFNH